MSSSNGAKTPKVSSLNLYKRKPAARSTIVGARSYLVIGRGKGRGLAKKPIIAPKPINLPSVKKESRGFDPSVVIIPVGAKPGWGSTRDERRYGDDTGDSSSRRQQKTAWGSTPSRESRADESDDMVTSRRQPAEKEQSPSPDPHPRRSRSESETAGKSWAEEAEHDDGDFFNEPIVFPDGTREEVEERESPSAWDRGRPREKSVPPTASATSSAPRARSAWAQGRSEQLAPQRALPPPQDRLRVGESTEPPRYRPPDRSGARPLQAESKVDQLDYMKQIGRAVQQECRDRSRMPSSA
eukprot:TRINITY_DN1073_c0_g1_i13.p1 TRINITY_DN1073_c0_g1~~TRINITY_DN1073_c0_g1_i13.p1  ORF type:complete len:298 (-),score=29.37 TRINITY_DN1073_c0_g1_i13:23-916(-)